MSEPTEQETQSAEQTDLNKELRDLGSQLERAVRGILNNDQAKNFQRDISSNINQISQQFETALKSINENADIKNLADQGQQVINQVQNKMQDISVIQDFQKALATGVSQLNKQLDEFISKQASEKKDASDKSSMQNIPIEEE